jgi:uncharacterized Tic20 family protein
MSEGDPNQAPQNPTPQSTPQQSSQPPVPEKAPESSSTGGTASSWATPPSIPFPTPAASEDRSWAVAIHISALISHIFGPLILWLIKRPDNPYLDAVGKEAVNFQLSFLIYETVATVVGAFTCGIGYIALVPLFIAWIIFVIIAGVKTSSGEDYRYPFTIRLIK